MTGALTPAGLGMSAIIPLMEAGFVDWIVSTGANLYHDAHFGLGLALHQGTFAVDDVELRENGVVRIYDIFFDYEVLLDTDRFFREIISGPEFQRTMSTAEFHTMVGQAVHAREQALGLGTVSMLSAAWQCGVPIYTSSPGDSSIGMNVAAMELVGNKLKINPNLDVNETAAQFCPRSRPDRARSACLPESRQLQRFYHHIRGFARVNPASRHRRSTVDGRWLRLRRGR